MEALQSTVQALSVFTPSLGTWVLLALVLLLFFWAGSHWTSWQRQRTRARIDAQCRTVDPEETIFVSIASYRDPECAETLFDLFEKAHCPFRIAVGVCQQNDASVDEDVLEAYRRLASRGVGDFSDRIRILSLPADEAKGPMYARHLIEKQLYRGERFYLITDSHMLFTPGWDRRVLQEWYACAARSPKPILTMYPNDFKKHHRLVPPPQYEDTHGTYLRFKRFNDKTGVVEIEGPAFMRRPAAPVPGLFWAACFSFGPATMLRDVPFDPFCDYVFFGEEILMAARLWTSGYDFYHPTTMHVYHMWERQRPTFWQQFDNVANSVHRERQKQEREGYRRLDKILQRSNEAVTVLPPYGLGQVRSLADYERLIGLSLASQQFTSLSGIMGTRDSAPADEILSKFGTWRNFANAKELLQKKLR